MACCKLSSSGVGALGSLERLTCLDLVGCVDGVTPDAMRLLSQVIHVCSPCSVMIKLLHRVMIEQCCDYTHGLNQTLRWALLYLVCCLLCLASELHIRRCICNFMQ